jgi:lysine-ketoglutarate reductase/saccharopine dehydrogenase-like protein (TIGR00300 family)
VRTEILVLEGHIIDSRLLPQVLDVIIAGGCDYELLEVDVGKTQTDVSRARIEVRAPSDDVLDRVLAQASDLGAQIPDTGDAALIAAAMDGVFPEGFYATTNLPTEVRIDGDWIPVSMPEMDCGIAVSSSAADGAGARTIAMSDVRAGDRIVVGYQGVKVQPLERPRGTSGVFSFMSSEVSSEKPQALLVEQIAATARATRAAGRNICWVLGPAVVHTGSAGDLVRLIEAGWVDVVFAGNALATHDAEAAVYGTSLGVKLSEGSAVEHGHEHHLRTINRVRAAGSFEAAVASGVLTSGIMHALVARGIPYVLAGSVRDDGPMPGVITDMLEAQRAMRAHVPGIGMAIMVSTMLHSIATGNMLPSSVATVCVDINPSAVTKLIDRGSIQSIGMVTDVGLFLRQLADALGA